MAAKPRFDGEWVRVSDAFDLRMGKTPSRKNPAFWSDGTHDWVSIADLGTFGKYVGRTKEQINELAIEKSGIKPSPENTVLMSFKLSLGKVSITTRSTYTNEAIMAFVDKGVYPVDSCFLYHQCRAKDWTADTNAAVMGKTLNKKTLGQATVFLPEISMQKEIAARLDFVESLISDAKEQLSKLDALVKSRFVEMFGDPTAPGDRWPVSRLDGFTKIITGNTPPRKHAEYYGDGIEWVKTDNIVDSAITAASERLTEIGRSKARVAPTGSILMACIAGSVKSIGKVGLLDREVAFNQQINAIVPMDIADSRYLLTMFTVSKNYLCSDVNQQLKGILNKSSLSSKQFPLPPLALQQEFASFVAEVDKSRFIVQKQIEKLQTLYDSLAQEYFS